MTAPQLIDLVGGCLGCLGLIEDDSRLAAAGVLVLAISLFLFERG